MTPLRPALTLHVSIAAPAADVYAFIADPRRLSQWATGLGATPTPLPDGAWRVETAAGPMRVAFARPNDFGVVDHVVTPLTGGAPAVDVPLRVVPNGAGSEVLLMLFQQEGMSDAQYAADAALVQADLARLKHALEHEESGGATWRVAVGKMPTPFESAQLNLTLFDLRRDAVLRESRAWFLADFNPQSFTELVELAGGARNAAFRMVLGYWDMAASLVTGGAIDGDAFRAAHGEIFLTFAKIHPFLADLRAATGEHDFCRHVETVVMSAPDAEAILARRRAAALSAARAGTKSAARGV